MNEMDFTMTRQMGIVKDLSMINKFNTNLIQVVITGV